MRLCVAGVIHASIVVPSSLIVWNDMNSGRSRGVLNAGAQQLAQMIIATQKKRRIRLMVDRNNRIGLRRSSIRFGGRDQFVRQYRHAGDDDAPKIAAANRVVRLSTTLLRRAELFVMVALSLHA